MYPCVSLHHYHGYYLFSGGCGDGWTEYNGVCYYVSASEVEEYTWREGRSWCMNKGGDLASVLSDEESQFIDQMVKPPSQNQNIERKCLIRVHRPTLPKNLAPDID